MNQLTHDTRGVGGVGFAVLSASSFGMSGALAGGLMDAGWSAAAAVAVRVGLAALVLLPPAWVALRGRWHQLRAEWATVVVYGLVAVAGCQLAYFNAVRHMEVGPALLIEYTAPVAVLGWAWLRDGHRPSRLTLTGSLIAVGGLVLVLDLVSGAQVSIAGVLWSLGAMVGAAVYFVLSAGRSALPPIVLAAGGLVVGALVLGAAGLVGLVGFSASSRSVDYAGAQVAPWVPLAALGLISGAVAYVAGIAASRRLGSRVASFVALLEVLFALGFAWLLLDELPGPVQLAGAVLVVAGVVVVKLGEGAPVQSAGPSVEAAPVSSPVSSSLSLPKPATTSLSAPS